MQCFFDVPLTDLTPLRLQEFLMSIEAPRNRQHYLDVLRDCLSKAVKNDLLPKNPCDNLQLPKYKSKRSKALTHAEELRFVAACEKDPYGMQFLLCLFQGLRIGETKLLTLQDFDVAKQTLKKYVKENRDNLNPEKINRLMSLKVPDEHLIKVACADQFSEKTEKKIHADTGSKPEYAFVSEKFASEMRSLKADRQKYAQMPPVQKESVTEKVNLQQKLKSVETVQAPSMMQKLQSQQNTNAQKSMQNVAMAKARMNGHQK